jgi:hypothetical protein
MPASQVLRFTDPDEYAAHVRATRMEIAVTEHGHFSAELIRIDLHRMWIQRYTESLPRVAHFDHWPGRAAISFPTLTCGTLTYAGREEAPGTLIRHSQTGSDFQRATGPVHFGAMSLPVADMEDVVAMFCGSDLMPPKEPLTVAPRRMSATSRAGRAMADGATAPPAPYCPASYARGAARSGPPGGSRSWQSFQWPRGCSGPSSPTSCVRAMPESPEYPCRARADESQSYGEANAERASCAAPRLWRRP